MLILGLSHTISLRVSIVHSHHEWTFGAKLFLFDVLNPHRKVGNDFATSQWWQNVTYIIIWIHTHTLARSLTPNMSTYIFCTIANLTEFCIFKNQFWRWKLNATNTASFSPLFTYPYFDLFVNEKRPPFTPKLSHWRYYCYYHYYSNFRIDVSFIPKFRKIHVFYRRFGMQ